MDFLTNEKLTIVGAAGMIGSNMAQTALMMRLTPNICLYDPFAPALEGVAEELYHCAFEGVNITWTTDIGDALTGASYVVSSGGAARKAGMTRENLLKGNTLIAKELGENIRTYCPDVKHVVIVFNPADITGLVTLIHAGIEPSRLSTLAALDSTRLRSELAKYFHIPADEITDCRTYGGHGEQMAVFASTTLVAGKPLSELIGTSMPVDDWHALQQRVIQGGKHIIDLRGRSSFQSPAYLSVCMIAAAMGGKKFTYPAGVFLRNDEYRDILMAMESEITADGIRYKDVHGTPEEHATLTESYKHLCTLRDEVIAMGVIPPVAEWSKLNPYLAE
ncbi:MAG: malate dehydrogenase [Alistipes sp.]|nr:malate dehydrogenase [Alistipes sp.]